MVRRLLVATALGGAVAGLLDIAMAAAIYQAPLDVIMRSIARGALGSAAMQGGMSATLLGLGLQVLMGALIGVIYGAASIRLPILRRHWVGFGVLYGIAVFVVMNWVVVPLSAVHAQPKFTPMLAALNIAAMIVFALVISASARRGAKA
ncbi:MAG: hypothetical protein BGN86_03270 [Caulobacterales bacterium 68-7]|nr:hypothetical protein [Caulobacterales bacterium]OJU08882.1 MAG: hypothetical protein BGN86_03270 [Caulobacterales bacterium 68-7]